MKMKKDYFKNFLQSPLKQVNEGQNQRRIMQENQAKRARIIAEAEHVENVRSGVGTVANDVMRGGSRFDEFVRTEEDTLRGRTGDIPTGGLLDDNTFGWLEQTEEAYSRSGCVSFSCALLGEAGARVPMNDKGGIEIYEEKKNGGKGGWVWYKSGDKMPIVPWNQRFDDRAEDLGFELQPEGTLPIAGDMIRQGYDEEYYDSYDYDDQGNGVGVGEALPGTHHSILATDSSEQGGVGVYNPGRIYDGLKKSYDFLNDSRFDDSYSDNTDRIQRYVGSTPYLEDTFEEWKDDENNQLKPLTSIPQSGIQELKGEAIPKVDIIARSNPATLTKKQRRRLN